MTVLLDTHVVHWWSADPDSLSSAAADTIRGSEELVVAGITWYELAWLAEHGRIAIDVPVERWLAALSDTVRTVGITPSIARTAAALPSSFPGDPADRIILATAVERGWPLVSKDPKIRQHAGDRGVVVW